MLLQPAPDRLHDLPAIAAGQVDKDLDPQHVVQARSWRAVGQEKRSRSSTGPCGHDKALEIVVIVPGFELVDRRAGSEIVFGCRGKAQRDLSRQPCRRTRD